ncbi:MAG: DUF456 family protein [Anaerolineae bacterium]
MLPWIDVALRVVILIGLVVSWVATIIPIFPAPTVMWSLTLIYGIVSGFNTRGAIIFGVISVLTIASWVTDEVFSIAGGRKGGAAWTSLVIAWVVGIVSSLIFTPVVGILLTVATVFLMECHYKGSSTEAWRATKNMLLGWGWATVARLSIGFLALVLWVGWAWL